MAYDYGDSRGGAPKTATLYIFFAIVMFDVPSSANYLKIVFSFIDAKYNQHTWEKREAKVKNFYHFLRAW